MEQNEKRLKQIDWSIIGIIVIIFILIHSIYLLINEKKRILNEDGLSDEEFLLQAIGNRSIASIIVIMFFSFSVSNLIDLINNPNSTEEEIKNQIYRVIISGLALLSILLDTFLAINNYIKLNQGENK